MVSQHKAIASADRSSNRPEKHTIRDPADVLRAKAAGYSEALIDLIHGRVKDADQAA